MPSEATKHLLRPEHSNGRVRLLILIAMVLGTVRLFESPPLQSANDRSRWATVWSLVERHTYAINEIRTYPGWDTIDKVMVEKGKDKEAEHFYSSKPPLFATIVAGGYWLVKNGLGWTIDPGNLETVTPVSRLLLFLINIVPTAFALGSLAKIIWRHGEISFTRNFILAAACFGTLWSAYLPSLNNHTPAICCVIFALRACIASVPASLTAQRLAAGGFMAGLAVTFELPALAFLAGLSVLMLKWSPRRALLAFLPMALLPLIAFAVTNYVALGRWEPAYASYDDPNSPYRYVENGIPSYWMDPKGLDRNVDPFYTYLFHCTFGHHGLFSLTPILLLSVIGLLRVQKWQHSPLAPMYVLGALLSVVVLGFYLSRTTNWNYGGVSVGLRWMIWLIPFWLLMMMPAVDLISGNRLGQGFLMVLMAPSVFSAWSPFDAPWKQPWIFNVMTQKGLLEQYKEPRVVREFPCRSWITQLPEGDQKDPDYWIELSGVTVDGGTITLRVSDEGPVDVGDRKGRKIVFLWNAGLSTERAETRVLDVEGLRQGDPQKLLLWPDQEPSVDEIAAALEIVCGVPVGVLEKTETRPRTVAVPTFRFGPPRYRFAPVRTDAFLCDIGVVQGNQGTRSPGNSVVYTTSEFWNTPEVPFGVISWDRQTRHGTTGTLLAVRRLSLVRVGKFLPRPEPPKPEQ